MHKKVHLLALTLALALPGLARAADDPDRTILAGDPAFTAVSSVSVSIRWQSTYPEGTRYRAWLSLSPFPNRRTGNRRFDTTDLSAVFKGLEPSTRYYAKVGLREERDRDEEEEGRSVELGSFVTLAADPPRQGPPPPPQQTSGESVLISTEGGRVILTTEFGAVGLNFPAETFSEPTILTLRPLSTFPSPTAAAGAFTATGIGLEIIPEDGVEPRLPLTLALPFLASELGGLDPAKLAICRYVPERGAWMAYNSRVDEAHGLVTAEIDHFSIFQIMEVQSLPAGSERVYPNPWRADRHSGGVTIDGLPLGSRVEFYNLAGRRIAAVSASGTQAVWPLTNENGESVASGYYLYRVSDASGPVSQGKLAILK